MEVRADGWDLVLRGGRVIDPESGLDAVRDVALADGRIAAVGTGLPAQVARGDVDVAGQVVTAGFIDLHSHVSDLGGLRLQALNGVTTALELEAGVTPVAQAYRDAAEHGRPINYGFAASWALARMEAVGGLPPEASLGAFMARISDPAWQRGGARPGQCPASPAGCRSGRRRSRHRRAARLCARGQPGRVPACRRARGRGGHAHVHPRARSHRDGAGTLADGAEEIVRAAAETGAHMHYCHVNSTSQRHIDRVLGLVARAQAAGSRVTTEAYPYGSGMTGIGAAFLAPERLGERGLSPSSLTYAPTGERIASAARLRELRQADPGGLVIIDLLREDDPADQALLMRSLTFPGAVVASDAMPLTWTAPPADPLAWPLPPTAITHPRTAGTFSRALRLLTRPGPLSLAQALAKCSLEPARLLQDRVPALRQKGRMQAGADADVIVFDPAAITDRASYRQSTLPSAGIRHVLVNGAFVVRDGGIVADARPGRPVRAEPR